MPTSAQAHLPSFCAIFRCSQPFESTQTFAGFQALGPGPSLSPDFTVHSYPPNFTVWFCAVAPVCTTIPTRNSPAQSIPCLTCLSLFFPPIAFSSQTRFDKVGG